MPVSRKKTGAQKCVIHRVKNSAAVVVAQVRGAVPGIAEEIARVIERHQDHDHAADDVDDSMRVRVTRTGSAEASMRRARLSQHLLSHRNACSKRAAVVSGEYAV